MKTTELIDLLQKEELNFLTGVPCSFLKVLLAHISTTKTNIQHVIAASEGEAVGIAAGYHLATNKVPVVYLQNSGFGNAVNPLTSLMDKDVYSMPLILFLTWRGEPRIKDEPQHKKMGKVMLDLLKTLDIPYEFASSDKSETVKQLHILNKKTVKQQKPVALIFRSDILDKEKVENVEINNKDGQYLKREEILRILLRKTGENPLVTTTGKTSREVFELREELNQSHKYDFLTVGSMGCSAGISLGIALQTKKRVYVIDGDGAVLMKMGTLATIGFYRPNNFTHIIIDNGGYESTGNQPSVSKTIKWKDLLFSVGYQKVMIIDSKEQLEKLELTTFDSLTGIVIYSQPGSRQNLGRPTSTPIENKKEFMEFVNKD